MGSWSYRWLFIDFWVPVWPNIAAALIGLTTGVIVGYVERKKIARSLVRSFHAQWIEHLAELEKRL
jgi:hypothetical protein